MVRIVERRGGICCCKKVLFLLETPNIFLKIYLSNMDFNVKSSNFHDFPFTIYGRFKILSYLCPRLKAFFAFAKCRNEQKSARFHIVTYIQ